MAEGNESFFASQDRDFDSSKAIQHVMVRQLLDAVQTQENEKTEFMIRDDHPLRKCMLIANVRVTNKGRRGTNYGLDDSTGRITGTTQSFDAIHFDTFAYARVVGSLYSWNGSKYFEIDHIAHVFDFYEVYHHILRVIQDARATLPDHVQSMKVTKKPLPSNVINLTKAMVNVTISDPDTAIDEPPKASGPPSVPEANVKASNITTNTEANTTAQDIEITPNDDRKLRSKIRNYILKRQRLGVSAEGVIINDIVAAMRNRFPDVTAEELSDAIEDLVASQKVYTTVDDHHFAAHEKTRKI